MKPLACSAVVLLVAVAGAAYAEPVSFKSRVDYPPLVQKLAAGGGSLSRVLHPKVAADMDVLESSRRYKFVVDARGQLAVAPLPADAAANEYVHPILAGGAPVATAGGIRVERADGKIVAVVVDQDSKAYCPDFASLSAAEAALRRLGIASRLIRREDHAPTCAVAK